MAIIDVDNLSKALDSFYSKIKSNFAPKNHGTHLTLGVSSATAFRGDYGNTAYNHSQAPHAPSNAQKNSDITKAEIEAKLKGAITSHTHSYLPLSGGTISSPNVNSLILERTEGEGYGACLGFKNNNGMLGYILMMSTPDSGLMRLSSDTTTRWKVLDEENYKSIATPANIGAAPKSHASTATTYGVSSASNYGHAMASGTTPKANGTAAVGSETAKFARGDHIHPLQTTVSGSSGSCTGNAATATKLATPRAIKIGNKSLNFDGSAALTYTLSDIGAAPASHGTHLTIGTSANHAAAGNHTHTLFTRNSAGDIGWGTASNQGLPVAVSAIAYWNGAYTGTSSNLAYCAKGAFGTIVTKNSGDYSPSGHGHTELPGEVRFPGSGTYSDPWNGTECAIKATGNIGLTGGLRANGGVATCGTPCGCATSDGATYVGHFRYAQSRGICDLGNNGIPGRLYIRSGQGTAGSGVYVECRVTDGNAYMQYLSPEAGTIALTSHLSDRTRKDNIVYIDSEKSEFTTKDFYDFIRDDLGLATYTLKENYASTDTHTKLNFIAQDILWDYNKNEEHKVGNLIVQAESAMEEQLSLKFDPDNYTSVIAGALKESINKIEELESKNKILEELVYSMNERLLKIESCSKEE